MTFASPAAREPRLSLVNLAKLLAFGLAPLALAGCKHFDEKSQVAGWSLVDPVQRHPIIVSQQPAHLSLHIPRGSQGLSPAQRAEVYDFASRFKSSDAGNSRLVISAPSGSANEVAAMNAVEDARDLLLSSGFNEAAIAVEAYHEEGRGSPPVRISYMRYVAEGPVCGRDWSENLVGNRKNIAHPNFGCAGQQNLAAMVANPADLLGPRTMTPRESQRRDVSFDKWVKGESTGAERNQDERVSTEGN